MKKKSVMRFVVDRVYLIEDIQRIIMTLRFKSVNYLTETTEREREREKKTKESSVTVVEQLILINI